MGHACGWLPLGCRIVDLEDGALVASKRLRRCVGIARESGARIHLRMDRLASHHRRQTSPRGNAGARRRICDGDAICHAPTHDLFDRPIHLDRRSPGDHRRLDSKASRLDDRQIKSNDKSIFIPNGCLIGELLQIEPPSKEQTRDKPISDRHHPYSLKQFCGDSPRRGFGVAPR